MVQNPSTKQKIIHACFLIEICFSNFCTMNNLCCKFSPIGNLSPHYTLTAGIDRTVDHTMDRGSKLKKTPLPPPRIGADRGSELKNPPPPCCLVPKGLGSSFYVQTSPSRAAPVQREGAVSRLLWGVVTLWRLGVVLESQLGDNHNAGLKRGDYSAHIS